MKATLLAALVIISCTARAQNAIPSAEAQIKSALMACPADKRDGAMVYGYDAKGEFVVLRQGTNEMVCIADDPNSKGFNAAAYHKDMDPFMERGRALRKEGKTNQEIFDIREQEVKAGKLKISHGSTLFICFGPDEVFNKETGELTGASLRYVVYIPYETSESTGLPLKPGAPGMPWIMDPGTHRAHIMINPPKGN